MLSLGQKQFFRLESLERRGFSLSAGQEWKGLWANFGPNWHEKTGKMGVKMGAVSMPVFLSRDRDKLSQVDGPAGGFF